MEGLDLLSPFDDIAPIQSSTIDPSSPTGSQNLAVNTMIVGSGAIGFKVDQSGIYLGGNTFAASPFSVSMAGVILSKSIVSGTYIQIDGGNARIVGNDGTTNRLVIGNV